MGKWTIGVAKAFVLIVALSVAAILIHRIWDWLAPEEPSTYLRTDLVAAQEAVTFVTGFATVAIVQFDTGRKLEPFSFIETTNNRRNVEGFCYRLYDLTIGYRSLWAALANAEASLAGAAPGAEPAFDPPEVLSANVVEARQAGNDTTQEECDRFNLVSPARSNRDRLAALQQALVDNKQWDSHVRHAARVLTTFSSTIAARRKEVLENRLENLEESRSDLARASTPGEFNEWLGETRGRLARDAQNGERSFRRSTGIPELDSQAPLTGAMAARGDENPFEDLKRTLGGSLAREAGSVRSNLADSGGFLGALKLTFSTIGIFTQEARRLLFWKKDEFYVRQDFAEVTYGSDFTLDVAQTRGGWLGPKRLVVSVPEPYLLSQDRYTSVLVAEPPDFSLRDDDAGNLIENAVRQDLQAQIERVEPHALRFAKALLTAQVQSLVEADAAEIGVRFVREEAGSDTLADLVRALRENPPGS
jgi:hypothetical protein